MEKLKGLFSQAKIKYVVSVDDCHQEANIPDEFTIKEHMTQHQDNAVMYFTEIQRGECASTINSLPAEDLYDYIDSVYATLSEENLNIYINSYMGDHQVEVSAKTALQEMLEELTKSSTIERYYLIANREDATELFENLENEVTIGPDKRVLWMIDKDLSRSSGSSDSGIELIKNFIASHKAYSVYALTSAQLAGTTNEEFRESISEHISRSDTLLACTVDKHNITEKKYAELYSQISHGFRQNYSATITKELRCIFEGASKNANKTIQNFGDDTLHKVFFKSGRAEGVSAIEVFQRLLLIIIREDIIKQVSEKYDEVSKLIHDYSRLCDWCGVPEKDYQDFAVIKKARIAECYDLHVNPRYLPVASGDIFDIGDQHFILLGQSCNLTIRENGERTAQCATLARISKANESEKSTYQLNYFRENETWSVDFNDCINVDFSVLDLCALNVSGTAELHDAYNLSEQQHRYTDAIGKKLQKTIDYNRRLIEKYRELLSSFSSNDLKFDHLCEEIRHIYQDNSTEVCASFKSGIQYNITRWGRISSDILEDILKRYSDYHSRKGLQHDFAKEYKAIPHVIKYEIPWEHYGIDAEVALQQLMTQYVFYQSGAYKNDDLKKPVLEEFCDYYSTRVLHGAQATPVNHWNYDAKSRTIFGSKDIPIRIGDTVHLDVLRKDKNGNYGYRVPSSLVPGLKNKQNQTVSMDNGAKLSISNGFAMFSFPERVPHVFSAPDILETPVQLRLSIAGEINLQISRSNPT